ncbi:Hypothetical protein CINCED_3A017647 [Cinara cedri]|uniref:Uncharacterized protein n=1 Tax=Cinara cedri TaxID=506608 RepID=A0A5E4MCE2_9HEMI|nr:Hypothetical protein CINCED_3A017647 [Cinara cedri]
MASKIPSPNLRVHNSPIWNLKRAAPPTFIKPLILPASHTHSTLSPGLLSLLQNSQSSPSSPPPPSSLPSGNNGLPGTTPTNPLSLIPPSILSQLSTMLNAQIPTPRVPQNGYQAPTDASNTRQSSSIPSSSIPTSDQPSITPNDKDSYPPESFPAPPIRIGPAPPPATSSAPALLPIQPMNVSPDLGRELMKFLSAAALQPSTTSPSQEPIKNENSNQIVAPSSDDDDDDDDDDDEDEPSDTASPPSPLLSSPSTPPASTVSKQSTASNAPAQPVTNPLLNLLLNSQSSINLLNSFLSLSAPDSLTTTAQPPTIKRSLNPSFIQYLSTLPRFQQTSD